MNRYAIILLIGLAVILSWSGIRSWNKIEADNNQVKAWERDTMYQNQLQKAQQAALQNVNPEDDWIQPKENGVSLQADYGPYLNAAQGVEVHLEGIRWNNKWFKRSDRNRHGIQRIGGMSDIQINQIIFDPDFPKSGMPDLNVEVTAPRFFKLKNFINRFLGDLGSGSFLGKAFDEHKPIKVYDLETTPDKRTKMSHWLIEFDTFLRIEPSPDHSNSNLGGLDYHPVSRERTSKIRSKKESKNQRYGNVSVLMKFKPKKGSWYIADRDANGRLIPNKNPKIGIAAVECISIKPVSQNKNLNNIGVYLRKGSSLALYDNPQEIDANYGSEGIKLDKTITEASDLVNSYEERAKTVFNESFVDREKYAILHLNNLGSWQEGSWLSSINRYADQYHAKFVIHAYVFGEWQVKPVQIVKPETHPPFEMKKPGMIDFLLPDFGLGFIGKMLSGAGWIIVAFIVLSIFFPPVGMLFNRLFGWVVALIPKPPKE